MTEHKYSGETMVVQPRDPHELLDIFASAEDLPTLPEVALRLQQVVNDPKCDAKSVAQIMQDDPAITTKVLKVVNSAFYAPSHGGPITELPAAIARLGLNAVTNIALSTSVFQACPQSHHPLFDRREFWRHSVCVGIAASVLHDYCANVIDQRITRDAVHLAGIVHDIGKILFERYANQEFHLAIESARQANIPVIKEECRLIGMGHDEAGAWLAQSWNIDKTIQAVVRWHHEPLACPEEQWQDLVKLVHLADYICHMHNLGDSANPSPAYDHRVREQFNLTTEKIGELMGVVEEEVAKSEILLALAE